LSWSQHCTLQCAMVRPCEASKLCCQLRMRIKQSKASGIVVATHLVDCFSVLCSPTRKEPNINAATVLIAKNNSKAVTSQRRKEELNRQQQICPIAKAATVGMSAIAPEKCTFQAKSAHDMSQNVERHFSALMGWPNAPWLAVQWVKMTCCRLHQHRSR